MRASALREGRNRYQNSPLVSYEFLQPLTDVPPDVSTAHAYARLGRVRMSACTALGRTRIGLPESPRWASPARHCPSSATATSTTTRAAASWCRISASAGLRRQTSVPKPSHSLSRGDPLGMQVRPIQFADETTNLAQTLDHTRPPRPQPLPIHHE